MFVSKKWRVLLIFILWIGSVALILLVIGARPLVITDVGKYYVSEDGAMVATCASEGGEFSNKIRFWDLHKSGQHSEFELPFDEDAWLLPPDVIFSAGNKFARAFGTEYDLINKTILAKRKIPRPMPWEQILFDENDRLVARWFGEYWDTLTMKPVHKMEWPSENWDGFVPLGNVLLFYHGKSTTIVDTKRRTKKTINLAKNYEDRFGIAPTGDYCGYFETNGDYHLLSVDQRTSRRLALSAAKYGPVQISPHGVYLSGCLGVPDEWLERGLEMLGVSNPPTWHLIDPNTGRIDSAFRGDNYDSVANPMFTADNAFVLAFDRQRSRLSVWALPVQDRAGLKLGLLVGFSLAAFVAMFKAVKPRIAGSKPAVNGGPITASRKGP